MRVLYISAEPLRAAQASATHVNEIVQNLRALGHDVTLCAAASQGSYHRTPLWRRLFSYIGMWREAAAVMKNADAVCMRAHPANFPLALLARMYRVPVVQEVNGLHSDIATTHTWLKPFLPLIDLVMNWQYRSARALIAVTPGLAAWLKGIAPHTAVHAVPNGANPDIFHIIDNPARAVAEDYALFFGGMTRWHGIETMLAALSHEAWPQNLHLVLIGEGQLRPLAAASAQENRKLHLLPPVPQKELSDYINAASLGLIPASSPAGRGAFGLSGLKLYEMLACGLPVVATDFPLQGELVRELGAGPVVPPDDAGALARAVAELYGTPPSPEKRKTLAAQVSGQHSWRLRAEAVDAILRGAVRA